MTIVGFFEGIASQRGIAWRCSDSRSLAGFLGIPINETAPEHSSLSRVHGRLPLEVHEEVLVFVLKIAADKKLLKSKTVGVDSTTLEANAAMKSIERKDTGWPRTWRSRIRPTKICGPSTRIGPTKGQQRGMAIADRSGQPHPQDEGRHHASGI